MKGGLYGVESLFQEFLYGPETSRIYMREKLRDVLLYTHTIDGGFYRCMVSPKPSLTEIPFMKKGPGNPYAAALPGRQSVLRRRQGILAAICLSTGLKL
jgi:hypothetical protein